MSDTGIVLVALVVARVETAARVKAELAALASPTRREAGCRSWALYECAEPPATFMTIERWASEADIAAHMASPYVTHAAATLGPLLAAPPQFLRLSKID